jgi:hypothetical protein
MGVEASELPQTPKWDEGRCQGMPLDQVGHQGADVGVAGSKARTLPDHSHGRHEPGEHGSRSLLLDDPAEESVENPPHREQRMASKRRPPERLAIFLRGSYGATVE